MVRTYFIYIFIAIASVILASFIDKNKKKSSSRFWLIILILLLSFFAGSRSLSVGRDSAGYAQAIVTKANGFKLFEPGYKNLIYLTTSIVNEYWFTFFVVSLLTNALILIRMYTLRSKELSMKAMTFIYVCFCYFLTFSGQRQWLAVAICFYATKYIYNDQKTSIIHYLVLTFIAFLFHTSSILTIVFLVPYVFSKRSEMKALILKLSAIVIVPVAAIFTYRLFNEKYFRFLDSYEGLSFGFLGIFKIAILFVSIYILSMLKRSGSDPEGNANRNDRLALSGKTIIYIEVLSVGFSLLGYFFRNTARISWYFDIFSTVYFGAFLTLRTKNWFILINKLLIFVAILSVYRNYFSESAMFAPYYFFWE